ncbi:hypothetical protein RJ639_024085 [Escallonia herrerae]|uniref:Uncharacterized protein n=1 Tax=Escallonia herrerae TaxID=1293975 RepID=A0AA88V3C5_9ASTE|nr:hypothetical protein RJ639_024085 [Escallonia herrerae]
MSNKPPPPPPLHLVNQRLLNRSFAPSSTFLHRHRHHHYHFSVAPTPSATDSSLPFSLSSRCNAVSGPSADEDAKTVGRSRISADDSLKTSSKVLTSEMEAPGSCEGLRWALAGKGVLVKENVFRNLKPFELKQRGATIAECNVKVRVISDSPSAILPLSSFLWKAPTRAISHDSCPVTVYVASSISPSAGEALGLQGKGHNGFITADTDLSSLILCGKAFADANGTKDALAILSGPIIASRGGLPVSAR